MLLRFRSDLWLFQPHTFGNIRSSCMFRTNGKQRLCLSWCFLQLFCGFFMRWNWICISVNFIGGRLHPCQTKIHLRQLSKLFLEGPRMQTRFWRQEYHWDRWKCSFSIFLCRASMTRWESNSICWDCFKSVDILYWWWPWFVMVFGFHTNANTCRKLAFYYKKIPSLRWGLIAW